MPEPTSTAKTPGVGQAAPDMERLLGVVQELSMARSLQGIQEIVRHAARELTGADGATFVLRDGDKCFYADEDAIEPLWKGKRFPLSACISGWAMLNRESVVIENIYDDSRIPVDAYRPTFVKSLAMVPIRTKQPVGAIGNYWAMRHRATENELRLLQALANSTSIAIENVSLMEELKAAKDAAEIASRLKDEFLSTVSHELRTPLTPILAWSDLLRMGSMSEAELEEAVEAIHTNATIQLRHVDDLLDVSKIIEGKFHLEPAPISLVPILEDAMQAVAPAAAAKSIHIECAPARDVRLILADPLRMQQVVWNLLSNAVKFTPNGGRVTVSLRQSSSHLKLVVADTGEGIPAEFLPHVFERFRQEDGTMTRAAGGMGLGLAIVRHLVELHGGTVKAESPGKGLGSTFSVVLPLASSSRGTV